MTPCRLRELLEMGFTKWSNIKTANRIYKTMCIKQHRIFGTKLMSP